MNGILGKGKLGQFVLGAPPSNTEGGAVRFNYTLAVTGTNPTSGREREDFSFSLAVTGTNPTSGRESEAFSFSLAASGNHPIVDTRIDIVNHKKDTSWPQMDTTKSMSGASINARESDLIIGQYLYIPGTLIKTGTTAFKVQNLYTDAGTGRVASLLKAGNSTLNTPSPQFQTDPLSYTVVYRSGVTVPPQKPYIGIKILDHQMDSGWTPMGAITSSAIGGRVAQGGECIVGQFQLQKAIFAKKVSVEASINMDGNTAVAIHGSQIGQSNLTPSCVSTCNFTGIADHIAYFFNMDGNTAVAWDSFLQNGRGIECDGKADLQVGGQRTGDALIHCDGLSSPFFPVTYINAVGNFNLTPGTAVSILANYNTSMDESVWGGVATLVWDEVFRLAGTTIFILGNTDVKFTHNGAILGFINADGTTSVVWDPTSWLTWSNATWQGEGGWQFNPMAVYTPSRWDINCTPSYFFSSTQIQFGTWRADGKILGQEITAIRIVGPAEPVIFSGQTIWDLNTILVTQPSLTMQGHTLWRPLPDGLKIYEGGAGSLVRVGDYSKGEGLFPERPALTGAATVFVNGKPAVFVGSEWAVHCAPIVIGFDMDGNAITEVHCHGATSVDGSDTVTIEGRKAVRRGDLLSDGDVAQQGSPNVFNGGSGGTGTGSDGITHPSIWNTATYPWTQATFTWTDA